MSGLARDNVAGAKRVVVKVGSSSISGENSDQITPLVDALAEAYGRGTEVVLISSGAVATGMPFLNLEERPSDVATQQAAAAVGQNVLIFRYQESLDRYGIAAGTVLLTEGDALKEPHRSNTRRALERLLDLRILPVVNENDTVAVYGLRFGSNDRLAALVATLIHADLLIMLSDVDALYTKPPHLPGAEKLDFIAADDPLDGFEFSSSGATGVGTGGASTKVVAARLATKAGTAVLVTSTELAAAALRGDNVGRPAPPFWSPQPNWPLPLFAAIM
ncbi:glutamate 5-kinase [Cryobacterium sp. TMT1-3]|uniref:glutamate 5-kinase n=1 Tax=Cryobacterium sp. TMT1-3 TaxID=1259237 RepID=UPI00106D1C90|nr:glutamate 5-kinase [Cryobacterium sp. TMT1-3]TFC31293.1 glutamate 5-kinase [Cryobacterium sp. TMT1-3]